MVKISGMSLPAGYQDLLDRILAYFDNQIYPTWATRNFHVTRSAKKANKEKTYMPSAGTAWGELSQAQKDNWTTAADFGTLNRYQLFLSDYSYRRKNGLTLPGAPFSLREMMGLRIQNPSGAINVTLRRDEKDLIGPIGINFTYLKTENAVTGGDPFKFFATAYYFENGRNSTETLEWSAPSGNVAWIQVTQTLGISGRKYFHLTIIWSLNLYDAIVDLDHLLITTNSADKYRENWQYKAGKVWTYENLYRKTGWLFTPGYRVPYFDVLYLDP